MTEAEILAMAEKAGFSWTKYPDGEFSMSIDMPGLRAFINLVAAKEREGGEMSIQAMQQALGVLESVTDLMSDIVSERCDKAIESLRQAISERMLVNFILNL